MFIRWQVVLPPMLDFLASLIFDSFLLLLSAGAWVLLKKNAEAGGLVLSSPLFTIKFRIIKHLEPRGPEANEVPVL